MTSVSPIEQLAIELREEAARLRRIADRYEQAAGLLTPQTKSTRSRPASRNSRSQRPQKAR